MLWFALLVGSFEVVCAAPTITITSPTRNVLSPGQSLNLSVTASGSGAVTYQWSRKGKAIAGATSATFVIAGATRADSGWYLVEATDASGTKRSKPIFVAVTPTETEVVAWGRNLVNEVTVPSGLPRITAVSTDGYSHTLALTASGAVVGWGYYSSDYSPLPIAEDGFVAVARWFNQHGVEVRLDRGLLAR